MILAASIASLLAICITPVGVLLKGMLSIGLCLATGSTWRSASTGCKLTHHTAQNTWLFEKPNHQDVEGVLIQAGYRSPWVVIMVIQSDDTRYHRLAIWQDQLPAVAFSYLHLQLMFRTNKPIRRTLSALLMLPLHRITGRSERVNSLKPLK